VIGAFRPNVNTSIPLTSIECSFLETGISEFECCGRIAGVSRYIHRDIQLMNTFMVDFEAFQPLVSALRELHFNFDFITLRKQTILAKIKLDK